MRHTSLRPLLAALLLIPAARAEVLHLTAGAPGPVDAPGVGGGWQAGGAVLDAPDHPLRPVITAAGSVSLGVVLPGGGVMSMQPLGITTGTAQAESAPLPRATPLLVAGGALAPRHVVVASAWLGVDELFTLEPQALQHDLLVHEEALLALPGGDLRASWLLLLPEGSTCRLESGAAMVRDAAGTFLARVPRPRVADASDQHWQRGEALLELEGPATSPVLTLVVREHWLRDPRRAFPLRLDPTVSLQPVDDLHTGFVDQLGAQSPGAIVSGSLEEVGFGNDVRGYAEFDTTGIPDSATVTDVRLRVWLANHDNPLNPAVPLDLEVKRVLSRVTVAPLTLHAAIPPLGVPPAYVTEDLGNTGLEWCPDAYVFRDHDLGPLADFDLQLGLVNDYFTVGFVSEIVDDPIFDHVDYIGYPETVNNPFGCPTTDFPGTRITLVVTYETNAPPVCAAGGPYAGDCPTTPIALDGSASFDPDDDPLTHAWTSDCSGSIANADQALATLQLDPGCAESCTVTLTVSDGALDASCTSSVNVADLTPPEITGNALDGLCLWPPRHDFVCLTDPAALVTAIDACQPGVTLRWLGCASDQPDEAREPGRPENGDGHFPGDCVVSDDGREICVRVERAGNDPEGRHYGLLVVADDGCGNTVTVGGTAFVPHDRSGGSGGQDDPCVRGRRL
jgi:hypothetical protein